MTFREQFGPKRREHPQNDELAVELAYATANGLSFIPSDRLTELLEQRMRALQKRLSEGVGLPGRDVTDPENDGWDIELAPWTPESVATLLDKYDPLPLECDGMTRVLHTVLDAYRIPHEVWDGEISIQQEMTVVTPHMWIELYMDDPERVKLNMHPFQWKYRIDYRARMWMPELFKNDPRIPHGLVLAHNPIADTTLYYVGYPVKIGVCSDELFKVLTCPI